MASCEAEVLKIGGKLEKILDGSKSESDAMDLLEALGGLPITIDVLQTTQIGKKINDFRKRTQDDRLAKHAKKLIKDWKAMLDKKDDGKPEKMTHSDSVASNLSTKSNDSVSASKIEKLAVSERPAVSTSSTLSGFPPSSIAHDDVRCKSAQMILNALRNGELPDGTLDPEDMAAKIEAELFNVHRGTSEKYKAALRSRVFNLRDKKNPALRENILTGVIKPERFAVMTSEEMASEDIKKMREKFSKDSILEHQMSVQQGTPSDMFKCGKCGKKNCTYTQLQTRSSDEPMTTFVYCLECGNRWKFC